MKECYLTFAYIKKHFYFQANLMIGLNGLRVSGGSCWGCCVFTGGTGGKCIYQLVYVYIPGIDGRGIGRGNLV